MTNCGIISLAQDKEVKAITVKRDEPFVWVTWLSKLMAGDVKCQWAPWFKTHYTGYKRAPSDFQLAAWTAEHTQLLDELSKKRSASNETIYTEDQNKFRVRRSSGLVISGKPDLIAIDSAARCTVYDVKTGNPRQSDIIQVMLYMMFLPFGSSLYKGKELSGCVVYKDGNSSDIPANTIDKAFEKNMTYFLDILELPDPPKRIPGSAECRYCDIANEDCQDRRGIGKIEIVPGQEPEIPM